MYPDLADELITLWKDEKPFSESELLNWKIIEQSSNRLKPSGTTLLAFLIITLVTTIYALTILDSISIRFFFLIVLIFLLIFWVDQILLVILILILILIPLVIISILMFFIKVTPSYENLDERIIEVALIALICLVARFGKKIKSIQIMVEKDTVRTQETERNEYTGKDLNNKKERIVIPSEDLWKDYYLHGRFRHLLRASLKFSISCSLPRSYTIISDIPYPAGDGIVFSGKRLRVLSFSIIMLLTFWCSMRKDFVCIG